jgi:Ser/Thr protein kinase RdoA (MazF antagonist)
VPTYNDYPLNELANTVYRVMQEGGECFLKFTCDYCGSRQTISTPNKLFTQGKCEECKSVTDIARKGGNLLVVARMTPDLAEKIDREFR